MWTQTALRQVGNGHTMTLRFHTQNHSCTRVSNEPMVLQIICSNFIAITISWFDFLHLLRSLIYLKLSKWMSRDIYLRERKAWSSELCPICPVISWRDAHWATAVDASWSEAWRLTWHCWYCALWVHLAVNSNITKCLRKIRTKTNRTPWRSLNWFGFGRNKIHSLFTYFKKKKRFVKEVPHLRSCMNVKYRKSCKNNISYLLLHTFILILSLMWQFGETQP